MTTFAHLLKKAATGLAAAAIVAAPSAGAMTLAFQDGLLIGADDVVIGGVSYRMRFEQGPCNQVFGPTYGSCMNMAPYYAVDYGVSRDFLVNMLFVDGPQGNFNSDPQHTVAFCCQWTIPVGYDTSTHRFVDYVYIHQSGTPGYPDNWGYPERGVSMDGPARTWVVFTVPEPSALVLGALGLPIVLWNIRRRRRGSAGMLS